MIGDSTLFVKSAGKAKDYIMTLFSFNQAQRIINKKNFKIIHHETHSLEIPNDNFYFEKYTFYCISKQNP